MNPTLRILNLGAGVQSTTLLPMACLGLIEKPDYAIYADTGYESAATNKHLAWLITVAEAAGIPVIVVNFEWELHKGLLPGVRSKAYLHRSCVPIDEVDLSDDIDRGQDVFSFWTPECEGVCGV